MSATELEALSMNSSSQPISLKNVLITDLQLNKNSALMTQMPLLEFNLPENSARVFCFTSVEEFERVSQEYDSGDLLSVESQYVDFMFDWNLGNPSAPCQIVD